MTVVGYNSTIDIYHKTHVADFDDVRTEASAIIHKGTEGTFFQDEKYHQRKKIAKSKGFLWGSYHFSSGEDVIKQVENYVNFVKPEDDEVICLDCEPSSHKVHQPPPPNMTYGQMVAFVQRVVQLTGRLPMVYGGHLLKDLMAGHGGSIVNKCPLWLAEYPGSSHSKPQHDLPEGWGRWTLWQYTDGADGPQPHGVKGIGHTDRDTFNGSEAEFRAQWPFTGA
jgi:lysozyme